LRGTLFSTVPINIDDKNLTKNREQRIFRANMNLLCLRFWYYYGTWSDSETDRIWRVKIKREGRGLWRMEGRRERAKVKKGAFLFLSPLCVWVRSLTIFPSSESLSTTLTVGLIPLVGKIEGGTNNNEIWAQPIQGNDIIFNPQNLKTLDLWVLFLINFFISTQYWT